MKKKAKLTLLLLLILASSALWLGDRVLTLFQEREGAAEKDEGRVIAAWKAAHPGPVEENPLNSAAEAKEEMVTGEESPSTGGRLRGGSGPGGITRQDDDLAEKLSFLQSPIPGATVSTKDSHLPGAPRTYRNGTHEGLDYYSGFCGVQVNFGDPVYAAGEGVILRIDHDYSEPSPAEREKMLQHSAALDRTPDGILDRLRGRQVWIAHAHGVTTRYAHLYEVCGRLQVGDWVERGAFIGTVGNSGTGNGARGTRDDAHLHFEIWLEDGYLGEGMAPAEIRSLLQKILADS